jgi:hypothetical protein
VPFVITGTAVVSSAAAVLFRQTVCSSHGCVIAFQVVLSIVGAFRDCAAAFHLAIDIRPCRGSDSLSTHLRRIDAKLGVTLRAAMVSKMFKAGKL